MDKPVSAITVDTSKVEAMIARTQSRLSAADRACEVVARLIRDDILSNTRAGKDVWGAAFRPYSARYAKYREDNHRSSDTVTLMYRNHMLPAMEVVRISGGASIRFNSQLERSKARKHNEGIGLPKRHFFGVSADTRRKSMVKFREILARIK